MTQKSIPAPRPGRPALPSPSLSQRRNPPRPRTSVRVASRLPALRSCTHVNSSERRRGPFPRPCCDARQPGSRVRPRAQRMRGRYGSADAVEAAKNQLPIVLCKSNRLMERGRNGARYFRNPPQPHMCIQDFIEETNEPCFINVLSWQKISTPRKPEDPIPLYGGMRVPHNSTAAMSLSSHFGAKVQPVIFAVMANPEILRLSGKTAPDPSDRDALVELMIDFVEAMNPDIRFKREFTVLKDRDLAGELKDIWLAVQAKRERERGENGRKEMEKFRDSKEEQWREEVCHRPPKTIDDEGEQNVNCPEHDVNKGRVEMPLQGDFLGQREEIHYQIETSSITIVSGQCDGGASDISHLSPTTKTDLSTTPSSPPSNESNTQHSGAINPQNIEEESIYSFIRSHYEQDFQRTDEYSTEAANGLNDCSEYAFHVYSSNCFSSSPIESADNVANPLFSENVLKAPLVSFKAEASSKAVNENSSSKAPLECSPTYFAALEAQDNYLRNKNFTSCNIEHFDLCENRLPLKNVPGKSSSHDKETEHSSCDEKSCLDFNTLPTEQTSFPKDKENDLSGFSGETRILNNKAQVPNVVGRSHEDLLPTLGDSSGVKFPSGSDHQTVAIP